MAAAIVLNFGQGSIAWFALMALLAIIILYQVGVWYKHHGLARIKASAKLHRPPDLSRLPSPVRSWCSGADLFQADLFLGIATITPSILSIISACHPHRSALSVSVPRAGRGGYLAAV
jgi:FSR family fosmidomycin resistance protein-like MFS transporter